MDQVYYWFIGKEIWEDKRLLRKAKLLVSVHLLAIFFILTSLVLSIAIDKTFTNLFWICLTGLTSSLFAFKLNRSFLVSGNAFIAISHMATLVMVYEYGSIYAPYLIWLFLIPVYAFVIANRKSALFWFTITVVSTIAILLYFPEKMITDYKSHYLKFLYALNFFSFFAFIFVMEYLSNSERKKLVEKIDFERNQIRSIVAKIPAGVAYIDKDFKLNFFNPVFRRLLNLSKDMKFGISLREVLGDLNFQTNLNTYQRALNGETVVVEKPIERNGKQNYIRCTFVPRHDQNNSVEGFIILIEDLTKIKAKESKKLAKKDAEKEALSNTIDFRNRELASQELFITNQKKLLGDIKDSLFSITGEIENQPKHKVKKIIRTIDQNIKLENEWINFRMQFERIHPQFIKRLENDYPKLNTRELRHCSYLRMRLSNKEIARIQNVGLKSVEMTNYRLKKKLGLEPSMTLSEFLNKV